MFSALCGPATLPISRPIHGRRQRGGTEANGAALFAVAGPALVFPPRHFGGVAVQVLAADPVILAPLRTTQTGAYVCLPQVRQMA